MFRLVRFLCVRLRLVGGLGPKGGHLDDLTLEVDVGKAKAPPHKTAVAEQPLYLARGGIGNHVEILRLPSQQQVTHTAAHEIADKAVVFQAVEDAQGVLAHDLAGDPMFLPGDDRHAVLVLFHPVTTAAIPAPRFFLTEVYD